MDEPKRKIFTLDDYSGYLDPAAKESLTKRGYFLVILPGGITGDLQVNDTDLHHPLKTSYHEKGTALMIEKLREYPDKIPSHSRDEIMKMCKAAFEETIAKLMPAMLSKEMGSQSNLKALKTTWSQVS